MPTEHDHDRTFDAGVYDEEYYTGGGTKSGYGDYKDCRGIIRDQFTIINDIMADVNTRKGVLDIGCAYGYSVERLAELGWNAFGCDISKFAIDMGKQEMPTPELKHRLFVQDIMATDAFKSFAQYDLVTGVEVFEHIETKDAAKVIENIQHFATWGFFVINGRTNPETALDSNTGDHGHLNNHHMVWWYNLFAQYGTLDLDRMQQFNNKAMEYNAGVHWHNRCVIVKFDKQEA